MIAAMEKIVIVVAVMAVVVVVGLVPELVSAFTVSRLNIHVRQNTESMQALRPTVVDADDHQLHLRDFPNFLQVEHPFRFNEDGTLIIIDENDDGTLTEVETDETTGTTAEAETECLATAKAIPNDYFGDYLRDFPNFLQVEYPYDLRKDGTLVVAEPTSQVNEIARSAATATATTSSPNTTATATTTVKAVPSEKEKIVPADTTSDEPIVELSSPFGEEHDDEKEDTVELVESLSQNWGTSLARLACAFAPPDHSIHPKDLEAAHVISVNEEKIEISAVLCEASGCVTVAVPVTFPSPCGGKDNMEACIFENIEVLDDEAHRVIEVREWNDDHAEELEADERLMKTLCEPPATSSDFPSWWIFPDSDSGMREECSSVKDLLNEKEFADELSSLATNTVQELYPDDGNLGVSMAGVSTVGPAGLLVRAQVVILDLPEDADRTLMVDLPVPFGKTCETVEDLRASVLGAVASAVP